MKLFKRATVLTTSRFVACIALAISAPSVSQADDSSVRPFWQTRSDPAGCLPFGTPAVGGGRLFVACSGIEAYAQDSGRLLWRSEPILYKPHKLIAAADSVLVVEATVSALDQKTGEKKWEIRPGANASLGRATTDGVHLYFGTSSHQLYCIRISDGKILWQVELGPGWQYPAVVRGVTAAEDVVFATVEQWRSENGTNASGWLMALDAGTGKMLWRYSTGAGEQRRGFSSSPVVTSNLVLVADYLSNAIEAIDRKTGHLVWRFEGARGFVGFPEAPVVVGDRVYAGSGDSYVYALDLATGHTIWRTKIPASSEGYVACGAELLVSYHGVAALDLQTGHLDKVLLDSIGEFVTSDLAVFEKQVFIAGPKSVFAFRCD